MVLAGGTICLRPGCVVLQAGPFCIFWSQNKGIKSPPPEGETHGNLQSSNPTNSLYQTGIGMTAFIQFIYCQLLDFLHVLSPRWACSNLSGCFKCCAAFISFMNIRRLSKYSDHSSQPLTLSLIRSIFQVRFLTDTRCPALLAKSLSDRYPSGDRDCHVEAAPPGGPGLYLMKRQDVQRFPDLQEKIQHSLSHEREPVKTSFIYKRREFWQKALNGDRAFSLQPVATPLASRMGEERALSGGGSTGSI